MNKKQIPIGELKVGAYVVELDRPWLGTPFAFQGFPIESQAQIDELKQYCQAVFIDLERERWSPDSSKRAAVPRGPVVTRERWSPDSSRVAGSLRGSVIYVEAAPVEKEVVVARGIYASCEEAMQESLQNLRSKGDIDAEKVTGAITSMSASIQRNPDAMMLLNTLRKKGTYELSRAMDTSILMMTLGRFLQYPKEHLEILGLAGMMLDLGKTKLPDAVLQKQGALSPDEYELVKGHVTLSVELVRAADGIPAGVDDIIVQHHERQDGSGYPGGLKAEEITIEGSIAGLVDSFSALTSARAYAEQTSPSNALSLIHKLRGKLFHEALVEQFIQCIGIYPVGSVVEMNTGEVGIVVSQNLVRRLQPRVMLILDRDLKTIAEQTILDLVKEPRSSANEPYRIRRTLPKDKLPVDPSEFFI